MPVLLARALIPRRTVGPEQEPALLALDVWAAGGPTADEATAIEAARIDVDALLALFLSRRVRAERTKLWVERRTEIQQILAGALAREGAPRLRALASLDSRADGPGLSPLAPDGELPMPAPVAAAIREVTGGVLDKVAA